MEKNECLTLSILQKNFEMRSAVIKTSKKHEFKEEIIAMEKTND